MSRVPTLFGIEIGTRAISSRILNDRVFYGIDEENSLLLLKAPGSFLMLSDLEEAFEVTGLVYDQVATNNSLRSFFENENSVGGGYCGMMSIPFVRQQEVKEDQAVSDLETISVSLGKVSKAMVSLSEALKEVQDLVGKIKG